MDIPNIDDYRKYTKGVSTEIIGIAGALGAGKTLLGVAMCWDDFVNGWKIYRNLKRMTFGDYVSKTDLNKIHTPDGQMSTLLLDEAYVLYEARGSGARTAETDLTYFALQSRKRGINRTIWVSQFTSSVDLRLRNICKYIYILPSEYTKEQAARKDPIEIIVEDFRYMPMRSYRQYWMNPTYYFGLYDSTEIVMK